MGLNMKMLKGQKSFYDLNDDEAALLMAAMLHAVESNRRILDRRDKLLDVLNDKNIKCHFDEMRCCDGGRGRFLQRKGVKFFHTHVATADGTMRTVLFLKNKKVS